ncbi:hypothetical protein Metev_1256 [Methanohalobium evestigatum Z-7303]|uniref:Sulfotransferase domain-containing protein n=1 Tax=Methanohalobium evestigatum (strain ATCC BAA-1072 / DSM 3721 / NBRC 107634 / OCM 161 / Z-7303) TaxID=644295 RepID=D7E7Q0_METEZ|nr:hypothetical protein [Methanohalobium evestigatum]ADI74123.1 hypothetical protein Metev_1256 [Methanohalobium evestigatum Z-7303]
MLYIHIGLPKTGTTFLQVEIFPKWNGIKYLGGRKKEITLKELVEIDDNQTYLISKEYLAGEPKIVNLAKLFPEAKIMVSFRKHDKWVTSRYKQYIQDINCSTLSFKEFFDIENNNGYFKKENLNYRKKIKTIEESFNQKPFVFLQEELTDNLDGVLKDMEYFMGGRAPKIDKLGDNKSNKGLGYYQSIVMMNVNKLFKCPKNPSGIIPYNQYTWFVRKVIRYILQNPLASVPKRSIKMDEKQKKLTEEYYKDDWNFVLNYIKNECTYRYNFDDSRYR